MKKSLGICLATVLCATAFAQPVQQSNHKNPNGPSVVHNGLWWEEKSGLFKEAFVGGYKAGSMHVAGHPLDVNKFPATELIDGLDHFYKDFRNRSILVDDALSYVEDQMRGVPDDKLAAEVLKMRAAAAPASVE